MTHHNRKNHQQRHAGRRLSLGYENRHPDVFRVLQELRFVEIQIMNTKNNIIK